MKKIITTVMVALTALFAGCAFWQEVMTNEQQVAQIATSVQGVTQTTVGMVVAKNPDLKEPFLVASSVIQTAFNDGNYDSKVILLEVDKALKEKKVSEELRTSVNATLTSALSLYTTVYKLNIETSMDVVSKNYITILKAACLGIDNVCGLITTQVAVCSTADVRTNMVMKSVGSYKPYEDYKVSELIFK